MKNEIAVDLLKIAAQLTAVTLEQKIETASTNTVRKRSVEAVFEDCLKAAEAHFVDLTGSAK